MTLVSFSFYVVVCIQVLVELFHVIYGTQVATADQFLVIVASRLNLRTEILELLLD